MKTTIDILATADIGKKELEAMIREAVELDTGRKIAKVKFKIGTRYEGYGPCEGKVTYFDGVHITFDKGE
jgi:hypothetical protein